MLEIPLILLCVLTLLKEKFIRYFDGTLHMIL